MNTDELNKKFVRTYEGSDPYFSMSEALGEFVANHNLVDDFEIPVRGNKDVRKLYPEKYHDMARLILRHKHNFVSGADMERFHHDMNRITVFDVDLHTDSKFARYFREMLKDEIGPKDFYLQNSESIFLENLILNWDKFSPEALKSRLRGNYPTIDSIDTDGYSEGDLKDEKLIEIVLYEAALVRVLYLDPNILSGLREVDPDPIITFYYLLHGEACRIGGNWQNYPSLYPLYAERAAKLLEIMNFCIVDGRLTHFNGKSWTDDEDEIRTFMSSILPAFMLTPGNFSLTVETLKRTRSFNRSGWENPDLIQLIDGVYDLKSGKLLKPSANLHTMFVVNVTLGDKGHGVWKRHLNSILPDENDRTLFQTFIGALLDRKSYAHEKILIMAGPPGTGKSTTADAITQVIGFDRFSHVGLNELMNGRFDQTPLENKLGNIANEMGRVVINHPEKLNDLTGAGARLHVEHKGRDSYAVVQTTKLIIILNDLPVFPVHSNAIEALFERLLVIQFVNKMRGTKQQVIGFTEKLVSEGKGEIFQWILEGYRLYEGFNRKISLNDTTVGYTKQLGDADLLKVFISEKTVPGNDRWVTKNDLYHEYGKSTDSPDGRQRFFQRLVREFGFKPGKRNGKNVMVGLSLKENPRLAAAVSKKALSTKSINTQSEVWKNGK